MSTNQTINGVRRELLERLLTVASPDSTTANPAWYVEELRALLAKPAAQNQGEPVCKGCGDSGVIDDKDKDELPSGHYVEKGLVSCPECEGSGAPVAVVLPERADAMTGSRVRERRVWLERNPRAALAADAEMDRQPYQGGDPMIALAWFTCEYFYKAPR